jgi:hypothetical protein
VEIDFSLTDKLNFTCHQSAITVVIIVMSEIHIPAYLLVTSNITENYLMISLMISLTTEGPCGNRTHHLTLNRRLLHQISFRANSVVYAAGDLLARIGQETPEGVEPT